MTSATNPNARQEQTILQLYTSMYHWGAIVAAPGFMDQAIFTVEGNPYRTSVTIDQDDGLKKMHAVRQSIRLNVPSPL